MTKKFVLIFFLLVSVGALFSQNEFNVCGTIILPSGVPADRASVTLGDKKTETDSLGQFTIQNIK